jgi:hypothetical protein
MCQFETRTYRCGHYQKALTSVCPKAKKETKICEEDIAVVSTTTGNCYLDGCDKKPQGIREGPGKSICY